MAALGMHLDFPPDMAGGAGNDLLLRLLSSSFLQLLSYCRSSKVDLPRLTILAYTFLPAAKITVR